LIRSRLVLEKDQRVGKTKYRGCDVCQEIIHGRIYFPRLPDIVLIAKEIDVGIDGFNKVEKCTRRAPMLQLVPLAEMDIYISSCRTNYVSRTVSRMIVNPMKSKRSRILL
jgi:hypothetical protein